MSWVIPQFEKVRAGQVLGSRHSLHNKKECSTFLLIYALFTLLCGLSRSVSLSQLFDGGVRNEGYATACALMAFRFLRDRVIPLRYLSGRPGHPSALYITL